VDELLELVELEVLELDVPAELLELVLDEVLELVELEVLELLELDVP
jgi:hypothetical protein